MAIPCAACGKPVHEHAVKCPHCGGATGVAPDTQLTYDEQVAAIELDRVKAVAAQPLPAYLAPAPILAYDPEIALIGGAATAVFAVGAAVVSAVEAVVDEHREGRDEPEIPRAIAHERRSHPHHVTPEPSREPEPALPPSDKPRFLK